MTKSLDPFRFLLMAVAGWMNQQLELIDYLREENRVLPLPHSSGQNERKYRCRLERLLADK